MILYELASGHPRDDDTSPLMKSTEPVHAKSVSEDTIAEDTEIESEAVSTNKLILLTGAETIVDRGENEQISNTTQNEKIGIKNERQMMEGVIRKEKQGGRRIVSEQTQNEDEGKSIQHVVDFEKMFKKRWSSELLDFLSKCFEKNVLERLSVEELLKHPFIAEHVRTILEHEKWSNENNNTLEKLDGQGLSVLVDFVNVNLPTLLIRKREKYGCPHQYQYQRQEVSNSGSASDYLDIVYSNRVMQSSVSACVSSDLSHQPSSDPTCAVTTAIPKPRLPCPVIPRLIGPPFENLQKELSLRCTNKQGEEAYFHEENQQGGAIRDDSYCLQISGSYTPPTSIDTFFPRATFPDNGSEAYTSSSSCYSDSNHTSYRSSNGRESSRNHSSRSRSISPATGGFTTFIKTSQNHLFRGSENRVGLGCSVNAEVAAKIKGENEENEQSASYPLLTVLSEKYPLVETNSSNMKNMSDRDRGTPSTVTATIDSPLDKIDCSNINVEKIPVRSQDLHNCVGIVDQTLDLGFFGNSTAVELRNKLARESLYRTSDSALQPKSLSNDFFEAATVTDRIPISHIPKFAHQDVCTHPPSAGKYFDLNFSGSSQDSSQASVKVRENCIICESCFC